MPATKANTPERRRKTCLFCGSALQSRASGPSAKAREHVIPDWLQRHLGIVGHLVTPTRVRTDSGRTIDIRHHVMGAFKAGPVCGACNHGWMAALEEEVKPILVRLIDEPRQLEILSHEDRFIVARWALKTAATLNRSSTYGNSTDKIGRPVPDEHLRILSSGGLPDGIVALGSGCRSNKTFDFLQYALWTTPANGIPLRDEDRDKSYKIALSFRDLIVMVAYYPSSDYAYVIDTRHFVPLWVGSRRLAPTNSPLDNSPSKSSAPHLERLLRNISVASNVWLSLVENNALTQLVIAPRECPATARLRNPFCVVL